MSEVQRIKCGKVNCYLVYEGDTAILIDTGTKRYLKTVIEACKPYRISLIVLTHTHYDHAENTADLSEILKAPIAMHRDDMNLIESNNNQALSAEGFMGRIILAASLMGFSKTKMAPFIPSVYLKDGDDLTQYGIKARVIGLPGHTRGSIGIDVVEKELIVGDALMNMFSPRVSMLYNDKKSMQESARKITKLGERTIYYGHGRPTQNQIWVS